ncbi:MAG: cation:proton antiporter [Planctomycetes bacterium]|nr:cation:proton antiporter [Planctomycetota bacterium]
MLAGAVVAFLVIRHFGEQLAPPVAATTVEAASTATAKSAGTPAAKALSKGEVLFHVLLALAAVMATGQVLGFVFKYLHQPPVIGEVVAGILLGPSLLGRISPDVAAYVLPPSVAPYLGVIAQLGVILYMFTVGLELNADLLRERGHATVAISHASIVLPFVLGSALALLIFTQLAPAGVPFTSFALFMGISMSVTAFPVLARILGDRQMTKTELGVLALTCAATDDVTAWCLLALVVGLAGATFGSALATILLAVAFIALMFLVVRPLLVRLIPPDRGQAISRVVVASVLAAVFLSALVTEWIGVHAIFGAFLLGAVIPHDSAIAREMIGKLEDLVAAALLPAFFAFTGMRTQIGLVAGAEQWLWVAAIIVVATLGKFGGSAAAARLTGLNWRDATALGVLMNTRGLMELIVLNIGLDMNVISPTLFAMMVLMALVTTIATSPALALLGIRGAASR